MCDIYRNFNAVLSFLAHKSEAEVALEDAMETRNVSYAIYGIHI